MQKTPYEDVIGERFGFLLKRGFVYEYLYDKGSDSSCVYIYRFRRGGDFLDFRAVSGGGTGNFVVFSEGNYLFPDLKKRHKKLFRSFRLRHLFRRPTKEEWWEFAARAVSEEADNGLFGLEKTENN